MLAPRISLGKFRRAVPEVWFDIIHVSADYVKGSVALREQTVEVTLGPDWAFETGGLTRARVTQVFMLLRLAPEIQKPILDMPKTIKPPCVSERALRPVALLEARRQRLAFDALMK